MFSEKTVKLPKALYDRAGAAAAKAGYSSTEEFIRHALELELARLENSSDKELALKQLKGLGYLE